MVMLKRSCLDVEGNCRSIFDDDKNIALVDKLRAQPTIDSYAESSNIKQDENLPSIFVHAVEARAEVAEGAVELNTTEEDEGNDSGSHSGSDSGSDSDDEEERLADEQLECNNSDVDEEREQGRANVTNYVRIKK